MEKFARNLDWNLLYTFMVVVQEKSMSRAAQALNRTQPAISQAIRRLEETAETMLIDRRKTGLLPTPAGQALLEQAHSVFATISRIPVTLEQAPDAISGRVSITMIDRVESPELDRVIGNFCSQYQGVSLDISVTTTASVIRGVELGNSTIGVSDGIIPSYLSSRELLTERYGLFCSADHQLAGRKDIDMNELRDEAFVVFTADVLGGEHMSDVTAFRARASIGQTVRGRSSYFNEVLRMIEHGVGIGFLPVHLTKGLCAQGRIWQLPPYSDLPQARVNVIWNPNLELSPTERAFITALEGGI